MLSARQLVKCARSARLSCVRSVTSGADVNTNRTSALLKHLTVREGSDGRYTATSVDLGWGRVYGGQTMAQAVDAVHRASPEDRVLHSFAAYFYRGGKPDRVMRLAVSRLCDGKSFSARLVTASQRADFACPEDAACAEDNIFTMTASLRRTSDDADSLEHSRPLLGGWPRGLRPLDSATVQERMRPFAEQIKPSMHALYLDEEAPFELRSLDFRTPWDDAVREPTSATFIRATAPLPDDFRVHAKLLAYICDWSFLSTASTTTTSETASSFESVFPCEIHKDLLRPAFIALSISLAAWHRTRASTSTTRNWRRFNIP